LVGTSLLAAACQDKVLVRIQDPPSVTIQEPSDGSSFYTGQTITFKALVVSNDGTALEDISHQWISGEQTICISEPVPEDGFALCQASYDSIGDKSVTVTITDPALVSVSSNITVNIVDNSAPTISITAPADGAIYGEEDLIVFEATVTDAEESLDNLIVQVEASGMSDIVVEGNATSAGQFSGAGYVDVGSHLVTMTVTDSYGKTAQDTMTLEVAANG
ncbi:unnamed protein product, partial [Ectocarpus fasciculatus]